MSVHEHQIAVLCPTEAQVRALLETARTHTMSLAESVICVDAFDFVCDAVQRGCVTWSEVVWDPHYAVAQIFDDLFIDDVEELEDWR